MGNVVNHTDLSREIPGLRAHVDLPLTEIDIDVTSTGAEWLHARDNWSLDAASVWPEPAASSSSSSDPAACRT